MNPRLERAAVYIDGDETYQMLKALRLELDFKALKEFFAQAFQLLRVTYYAIVPDEDAFCTQMPLLDWLEYNGFTVTKKRWRLSSNRRRQPNISIEMSIDLLTTFPNLDRAIIISGDQNLLSTVRALKSRGVRVTVIWTLNQDAEAVPDALRREADDFIDILSLSGIHTPKREQRNGMAANRN